MSNYLYRPRLIELFPADCIIFDIAKKESSLIVENKSSGSIAFKVKTSSPKNFLVSPTAGVILPFSQLNLKISLLSPEEALQKSHKFLIQALPSNDLSKVNWNNPGIEEHKIAAKIIAGDSFVKQTDQVEKLLNPSAYPEMQSAQVPKPIFVFSEQAKENIGNQLKKIAPGMDLGKDINSPEKTRKSLSLKSAELAVTIDNLKAEVEKAGHKLKFTTDLEQLTFENPGKYGIMHLIGAFLIGFILAYYIIG